MPKSLRRSCKDFMWWLNACCPKLPGNLKKSAGLKACTWPSDRSRMARPSHNSSCDSGGEINGSKSGREWTDIFILSEQSQARMRPDGHIFAHTATSVGLMVFIICTSSKRTARKDGRYTHLCLSISNSLRVCVWIYLSNSVYAVGRDMAGTQEGDLRPIVGVAQVFAVHRGRGEETTAGGASDGA